MSGNKSAGSAGGGTFLFWPPPLPCFLRFRRAGELKAGQVPFKRRELFALRLRGTRGQASRGVSRRPSASDRKLIEESPLSEAAVLWAVLGNKGGGGGGGGGSSLPYLNWSSTALTGTGTSVNRRHSKGIKEALHWFVLEAVLLICLPTNECLGPVFPACVDNGTPSLY